MIDIGLNLTSSQFAGEQADLVERARAAGVEALILTGTDLAGSRESAALAARCSRRTCSLSVALSALERARLLGRPLLPPHLQPQCRLERP